jgi:hypothetical protein
MAAGNVTHTMCTHFAVVWIMVAWAHVFIGDLGAIDNVALSALDVREMGLTVVRNGLAQGARGADRHATLLTTVPSVLRN